MTPDPRHPGFCLCGHGEHPDQTCAVIVIVRGASLTEPDECGCPPD